MEFDRMGIKAEEVQKVGDLWAEHLYGIGTITADPKILIHDKKLCNVDKNVVLGVGKSFSYEQFFLKE